ncbi:MAG: hypothetical protein DME22_20285 [Verrucomicrobia bacterium]|nr:MAG: hypothetical protein DME22_20285 [Verrucomicrobiota bacterium]PYK01066.1 MAG: hypothetical protein DME23_05100 [Verrucomicrobiota bacterium]
MGRIIKALASDARAPELTEKCDGLIRDIRRIPPDLTEMEISRRIGDLAAKQFSWAKNDDGSLVRGLRQLANAIDRVRKLKSGGVAAFSEHPKLKARLENVIEECKAAGLFLVPVGELEDWSTELMKDGPSRERKAEWTNEFVKRMRQEPSRAKDIIDFVTAVDTFHGMVAGKLATIDLAAG